MLAEWVLTAFSRSPDAPDFGEGAPADGADGALDALRARFPTLADELPGRAVLDFGCGQGRQVVGFARAGAREVVGLDTNVRTLAEAQALALRCGVSGVARFAPRWDESLAGRFDLVVSLNSMEHFDDPAAALDLMRRACRPGGTVLISFGPPWLAPYGAHMHFFTRLPWVNLLFSERTVLRVRARYRSDGATRYEEVTSGLNRLTVGRFEELLRTGGLRVLSRRYDCVKGLRPLGRLPGLREFFINSVSCRLMADAQPGEHGGAAFGSRTSAAAARAARA